MSDFAPEDFGFERDVAVDGGGTWFRRGWDRRIRACLCLIGDEWELALREPQDGPARLCDDHFRTVYRGQIPDQAFAEQLLRNVGFHQLFGEEGGHE